MYKEDYNSKRLILDDVCLVDIPNPISKNNSSYVHIKQSNFKANARNSTSLRCVFNNSLAFGIYSLYSLVGTNSTILNSKDTNSLNSCSESLDFCNISFLWLNHSFFNFLYIESLTFFDNSSASFSVNLDLDTIFLNSFNISCRLSSSTSSLLANSDQFTQDSFFISDLNSSGIANVKDVIYLTSNYSNFLNCLTLDIIIFLNTSDHLTSGNLSIFSFTFSDIDKVIVAIFNLQPNYVYKRKYVDIYKTFDFKKNLLILSSKTLVFFILTYLMYNYYKKRRLRNLNK